jgi:hypothetical protein
VQEDDHRPVRPAVNSDGSARVLDLPIAHHIAKSPFTSVVIATRPLCSSASPNRDKSHAPICRPDQLKFSQRCPVADRVPRYSKSMTNPRVQAAVPTCRHSRRIGHVSNTMAERPADGT